MRISLVTVIASPHQLPLAQQLADRVGGENFRYIATEELDAERKHLGWNESKLPEWFLCTAQNSEASSVAVNWLRQSDMVLCGNRDVPLLQQCQQQRKLTFYTSERWFKPWAGFARLLSPKYLRMALAFRRVAQSPWLHYLPIGLDAARDMRRLTVFSRRMWLWGYYVDVARELRLQAIRSGGLKVLWVGRMLGWKRVHLLVNAIGRLQREGRDCRLTLVGSGECETALRKQARLLKVENRITFRPPVPIAEVRAIMRSSDVYVLPSDGNEGWGAVINEALSEGCCVVADRDAGAAHTMILHGENGLLFRNGSEHELCACLRRIYDSDAERIRLARAGYETIGRDWTPAVAAERLLALSDALLAGCSPPRYTSGPLQPL